MAAFEIRPFDEASLNEIGDFFTRSLRALQVSADLPDVPGSSSVDHGSQVRDFRWLLDEGNPARQEGMPSGEVIRNDQGAVAGMIGYHPEVYRLGERRLIGLGAHNFYVDPEARMQGFFLFRRYLNHPAADFCYSTTCNSNSGPLWSKCGASVVPNSDTEFVRIFRTGPVLQELALRKKVPKMAAGALGLLGPLLGLVIQPRRPRNPFLVERCTDWDQLADIAERERDPLRLTPERSAIDLRNRYEQKTRIAESTGTIDGVYRFSNPSGPVGWFAAAETRREKAGDELRSMDVLDIVWPRRSLSIADVLPAVMEVGSKRTDFLKIRDFSGWGLRAGLHGLRQRALSAPEAFVFSRAQSGLPTPAELARISEFPAAYGV